MAGIYIHIPFCKKACNYCDFHFSTSLKYKAPLIDALVREIALQEGYLQHKPIQSVYLGGGTPSLLSEDELQRIFEALFKYHTISPDAEMTLEANPDDLSFDKLQICRATPINRLSIGIQSFFEEDLLWMNRTHTAVQAEASVKRAQDVGFENLSLDLIYGFPSLTKERWTYNIQQALQLEVPHISAYCLAVESKTALAYQIRQHKTMPMDEGQGAEHLQFLMQSLSTRDFLQYEISNFSKKDYIAKHNSSYWKQQPYLGIGPSAHSYNIETRQWNVAHNLQYISQIEQNKVPAEVEILDLKMRCNEYILTSLRTSWGMDLVYFCAIFGDIVLKQITPMVVDFKKKGWIQEKEQGVLVLSNEGKLFADYITSQLFLD